MHPITGGLLLKRKKIHIKWQRLTRPSPITGGNKTTGILENWNDGFRRKKEKTFLISRYSTIPSLKNYFIMS
jgi:hypothetical protein